MARHRVTDGEDGFQTRRVTAKTLNKQSRTWDKGWSSNLEFWQGTNDSSL